MLLQNVLYSLQKRAFCRSIGGLSCKDDALSVDVFGNIKKKFCNVWDIVLIFSYKLCIIY